MNGMTEITGCNLVHLAQKAYELSVPQGLGFIHFVPGELSEEDARDCVQTEGRIALSMDYVRGRACKLTVFRDKEGKLWVDGSRWFDHSAAQLYELAKVWEKRQ